MPPKTNICLWLHLACFFIFITTSRSTRERGWTDIKFNKWNQIVSVQYYAPDATPGHLLYQSLSRNALRWRHNGRDGVSTCQPHDCFLNSLFGCRSKKTSKLRVTGFCAGKSPETDDFPAQMVSNAENVSTWWRHHDIAYTIIIMDVLCCYVPQYANQNTVQRTAYQSKTIVIMIPDLNPLTPVGCGCPFNTLRPRQNGCHFADGTIKYIFLNENVWI